MSERVVFLLAVAVGTVLGLLLLGRAARTRLRPAAARRTAAPRPGKPAHPRPPAPRREARPEPPNPGVSRPGARPEAQREGESEPPLPQAQRDGEPPLPEAELEAAPADSSEKRRHERLPTDEPLLVTPFAGRETLAEMCDVSQGGLRFRVVGLAPRDGDLMHVTFNLAGESLTAVARVLRIRALDDYTCEVAAQFARLDPWAARRFEEALASRGDARAGAEPPEKG